MSHCRPSPERLRRRAALLWAGLWVCPLVALASVGGAPVDLIDTLRPAAAVYGVGIYPITFDHAAHAGLAACDVCHEGVGASGYAAEQWWPEMSVCAECHPEAADTDDADACGTCHSGYRPAWPDGPIWLSARDPRFPLVAPQPAVHPRRNLLFSHLAHDDLDCARCHDPAARGGAALPENHACRVCHEGAGAETACSSCHPVGEEGRLITAIGGNALIPTVVLRPRDHDRDWALGHGLAASLDDAEDCRTCHDDLDCQQCHDGVTGVDNPHPPGFTAQHSLVARREAASCAPCHTASQFCVDCHIDANVTTEETSRPPLGTVYHPGGWVTQGGGDHALEAQRSLLDCASCHAENDCARCHVFVDPHGPDFLGRCGRLLAANPRVCAPCHSDPEPLRMLCN